ncbi:DP-EP family protein [Gallaecimonas mangrovi]|uniref:DP-EP family protein n=1 Tax=Gallaecimonas mangrovi TaxID=2291597 RepID=UPI000E1FE7C5|nr:DP-EP family protein [Gallaecimonas mangrovi]
MTMPATFTGVTFDVTVELDSTGGASFLYYTPGKDTPSTSNSIEVTGPEIILYRLKSAPDGFRFIGAVSKTPYNGVIEQSFTNPDGDQILLEDLCMDSGSVSYHLLLSNGSNAMFLMSPDPEVINKN